MARFVRNKKAKGTAAENELIHKFWELGEWVAVRVAGSGSTKYPSPDLLVSRGDRKLVLEIKVVSTSKKYFSKKEIKELEYFGLKFGAESWVGVKFSDNQWFFMPTSELNQTKDENYSFSLIDAKTKGFSFEELINLN
jgi:Holliday junction resolvase